MGFVGSKLVVLAGSTLIFGVSSILFAKAFGIVADSVRPRPKSDKPSAETK